MRDAESLSRHSVKLAPSGCANYSERPGIAEVLPGAVRSFPDSAFQVLILRRHGVPEGPSDDIEGERSRAHILANCCGNARSRRKGAGEEHNHLDEPAKQ